MVKLIRNKIYIILFISLVISLFGIALPLYADEVSWIDLGHMHHPPITPIIFSIFMGFLGKEAIALRIPILIFSLANVFLVYIITKEQFNKKTALLASLIMVFSFYHVLSSIQIDIDSFLIFGYLMTIYFFFKSENENCTKWKVFTGISLGFVMLIKHHGVIFYLIILIYKLIKDKKPLKTIKELTPIFLLSVIIYSIFPIYSLIVNNGHFMTTIKWLLTFSRTGSMDLPFGSSLIILFLWATPFLLGIFVFYIFNLQDLYKDDKHNFVNFYLVWAIVILLFNILLLRKGDFTRYYMALIPVFCILGAKFLIGLKITKNDKLFAFINCIVFYIIFVYLNSLCKTYVANSVSTYISNLKILNFNFFLNYAISSGSYFGVSLYVLIALGAALLTTILPSLYSFKHKKKILKLCLISFLSVSFAFNVFLIGEYLFHISQPNPANVVNEIKDYVTSNDVEYPIFVSNKVLAYYSDPISYIKNEKKNDNEWYYISRIHPDHIKILEQKGGMVLYNKFGANIDDKDIIQLKKCIIVKEFSSKGVILGKIYSCPKNK